ncbi:MAG: hemerythrin domain-containing protein [Thiobacillus sp.]
MASPSMSASLLGKVAPGFDHPLDVLEACHVRIAQQCDTLEKLLNHLPSHGADVHAQQAARAVLTYFDTAAVHHHDDEERNLFPLLELANAPGACDLVTSLTLEHELQGQLWRSLQMQLARLAAGESSALDARLTQQFVVAQRRHFEFENAHILPLARAVLDAPAIARLGRAMAARRVVRFAEAGETD